MNAHAGRDFRLSGPLKLGILDVEDHKIALQIEEISEICVIDKILPMLCACQDVLGAINLRGALIPLLDPLRLCQDSARQKPPKLAAVLQHDGRSIALGIDAAHSIIDAEAERIQNFFRHQSRAEGLVTSGLLTEEASVNLLRAAAILERPGLPSGKSRASKSRATDVGDADAVLTFEAGGASFGLAAISVFGTVPRQEITPGTLAGGACLGTITYLGRRIPIMDATSVFGLGDHLRHGQPEIVIVNYPDDHLLGFAVDVVSQVRMVQKSEISAIADNVRPRASLLTAAIHSETHQIFMIATDSLTSRQELLEMSRLSDQSAAKAPSPVDQDASAEIEQVQMRCLLFTAGVQFGARITDITSILSTPGVITPINRDAGPMIGLFTHNHMTTPLICLAQAFGKAPCEGPLNRVLVVGSHDHALGFRVDSVDGIETSAFLTRPGVAPTLTGQGVKLKTKKPKGLLSFLDLKRLADDGKLQKN
ncbi:MAG: chemotaxis protein CheW [Pseudomonadota bacterium]